MSLTIWVSCCKSRGTPHLRVLLTPIMAHHHIYAFSLQG